MKEMIYTLAHDRHTLDARIDKDVLAELPLGVLRTVQERLLHTVTEIEEAMRDRRYAAGDRAPYLVDGPRFGPLPTLLGEDEREPCSEEGSTAIMAALVQYLYRSGESFIDLRQADLGNEDRDGAALELLQDLEDRLHPPEPREP